MHEFFDYLNTPGGGRLLGIVGNVLTIIAAVISGKALQNTAQLKKAIGGTVKNGFLTTVKAFVRRGPRHGRSTPVMLKEPPKSLLDQIEGLKNTYERAWVNQGITNTEVKKRLDRVDPRRH